MVNIVVENDFRAYVQSAVLVIAGIVLAVVIDDLVRNIIVGNASKLHSLIMFFSVIGGIHFFGIVGIVAGPWSSRWP